MKKSLKYRTEDFDREKHTELNFLYNIWAKEGSERFLDILVEAGCINPVPRGLKLLSKVANVYQIIPQFFPSRKVIVIYKDKEVIGWINPLDLEALKSFLVQCPTTNFDCGYILGTFSPYYSSKGMVSANNYEGYQFWIKNK